MWSSERCAVNISPTMLRCLTSRMAGYDVFFLSGEEGLMSQMLTLTLTVVDNQVLYFPAPSGRLRSKHWESLCSRLSCRWRPPIWPCTASQVTDLGHKWRPCPQPADSPAPQFCHGLARPWMGELVTPVCVGVEQWAVIAAILCRGEVLQCLYMCVKCLSQWMEHKWQKNSNHSRNPLCLTFTLWACPTSRKTYS